MTKEEKRIWVEQKIDVYTTAIDRLENGKPLFDRERMYILECLFANLALAEKELEKLNTKQIRKKSLTRSDSMKKNWKRRKENEK